MTPKLRFKGFDVAWEQRELGEIFKYEQPQPYIVSSTEYSDDYSIPVLTAGQSFILGYTDEDFGIKEASKSEPVVIFDDFTTSSQFVDFPFKVKSSAMKLLSLANKKDNIYFAYNVLKNIDYKSVTHERHWISIFSKMSVLLPSCKEQEKIGAYFKNLDNLITLHQRKCEALKKQKQFFLQNMFPKEGETVPRIRFNGFTEPWEQRKLGDIFTQTCNTVNLSKEEIELWSLTVEAGLTPKTERYARDFLVKKEDIFKKVLKNEIVYNPMNMTLGAIGFNSTNKTIAVSGYYVTMKFNEGFNPYCIKSWMKSSNAISLYKQYATGSLKEKQRIQYPTLSIIPVKLPSKEEQEKIGACFENIDNLITLHQRQYEQLVSLKKYLLSKMFI